VSYLVFLAPVCAYLIGSIPFGYLIVRHKVGDDIRETGSGGTGATNVSRRAGKAAGVITLLLDALKGALAIIVAQRIIGEGGSSIDWLTAVAAIAAIAGHIFPVWLKFRGGKGVATGAGVFLMLAPIAVFCAAILFLVVVSATKYISLGSMVAAAMIPLFVFMDMIFNRPISNLQPLLVATVVGAMLIVFAHRGNIRRLAEGTEPKFRLRQ
jgi:acyl phosphate:glycerol-3-phosphate acyltransferase